jgi:hypothetical protein
MRPIDIPETSVSNQLTLRNNPENGIIHLLLIKKCYELYFGHKVDGQGKS